MFKKVIAPIAIIVLVLGCIYAGIATPTEAAGVGAFASMVYALITRKLNVKNLRASLIQTMEVSAMLMWILMGGAAYNSLVNITRLSDVVLAGCGTSGSGHQGYVQGGHAVCYYFPGCLLLYDAFPGTDCHLPERCDGILIWKNIGAAKTQGPFRLIHAMWC